MLFYCFFAAACALAQTGPAGPTQVPPETVVLRVGDTEITAAQFDTIAESLPAQYRAYAKGAGRKQFAGQLARILVLAQEGYRRKLDQNAAFQIQSKYRSDELMANLVEHALGDSLKIDDAVLRAYYEAHKSEYERVRVRHILIRTQGSPVPLKPGSSNLAEPAAADKAKAVRKKVKDGADFAAIASVESDDVASAASGGDLGWLHRGNMAAAFEEAAFRLKPDEISEPVRTPFGYHIIKVEGHETDGFDQVKSSIEDKVRPEKERNALDELQRGVKIDYNATFFETAKP